VRAERGAPAPARSFEEAEGRAALTQLDKRSRRLFRLERTLAPTVETFDRALLFDRTLKRLRMVERTLATEARRIRDATRPVATLDEAHAGSSSRNLFALPDAGAAAATAGAGARRGSDAEAPSAAQLERELEREKQRVDAMEQQEHQALLDVELDLGPPRTHSHRTSRPRQNLSRPTHYSRFAVHNPESTKRKRHVR